MIENDYEYFLKSVYTRPYELINKEYPLPKITVDINISLPIELDFNIYKFFKKDYIYLIPSYFKYPIKIIIGDYELKEINNIYYSNEENFNENLIKINYFEEKKYENLINKKSNFFNHLINKEKIFYFSIYNNLENIKNFKSFPNYELQLINNYYNKKPNDFLFLLEELLPLNNIDIIRLFLLISNKFNIVLLKILELVEGKLLIIFTLHIINLLDNSLFKYKKNFYIQMIIKFIFKEFQRCKNKELLKYLNNLIIKYELFESYYYFIINLYLNKEISNEIFQISNTNERKNLIKTCLNISLNDNLFIEIDIKMNIKILNDLKNNQQIYELLIDYFPIEIILKNIKINCIPSPNFKILNKCLFIYFPKSINFYFKSIEIKLKNFNFNYKINN